MPRKIIINKVLFFSLLPGLISGAPSFEDAVNNELAASFRKYEIKTAYYYSNYSINKKGGMDFNTREIYPLKKLNILKGEQLKEISKLLRDPSVVIKPTDPYMKVAGAHYVLFCFGEKSTEGICLHYHAAFGRDKLRMFYASLNVEGVKLTGMCSDHLYVNGGKSTRWSSLYVKGWSNSMLRLQAELKKAKSK